MKNIRLAKEKINPFLPGLFSAFFVAALSKRIALFLPSLGAATIAILLGIVLGNTLLKKPVLDRGTKVAESKLLECSIVLLGTTVTFQTIAHIGIKGGLFILLQMAATIIFAYFIGLRMKFSQNMALLMAGGNAVCGSSAIAAIAPAIDAKDEEKGQIITLVNLLGTLLMLILPVVSTGILGTNMLAKSALIGGTLQSVGQVVASASMLDDQVVEFSMLFKLMRIMLLILVVSLFGYMKQKNPSFQKQSYGYSSSKRSIVPWYIIGFVLLCILNSLIKIPDASAQTAHFFSNWFEITALAAIGLRLNFKNFLKEGKRFLLYGLSVGIFQLIAALVFILILSL